MAVIEMTVRFKAIPATPMAENEATSVSAEGKGLGHAALSRGPVLYEATYAIRGDGTYC